MSNVIKKYAPRTFYCAECKCKLEEKFKIQTNNIKNNDDNTNDEIKNSSIKNCENIKISDNEYKRDNNMGEYKQWKKTRQLINMIKSDNAFKDELIKELGLNNNKQSDSNSLDKIINLGLLMKQFNGSTQEPTTTKSILSSEQNEINKILGIK
jgi:transcription initiation factor TFIIIB Brf1 subunit/transcription initiation factor TFIIB